MTISTYSLAIETFVPMLRILSTLLEKGGQFAATKSFDTDVLVNARLAPDMFPLARQVQIACDHAKNGVARLIAQEPPRFEDTEKTLDELLARIAKTLAYLESIDAAAFEGADDRDIVAALHRGMTLEMKGFRYLRDWALPNFYFHVVTAYDILRNNGVDVGKRDFLSHTASFIRPANPAA